MKYIELTQNKKAIVDDEDYERLNQWKWYYLNVGYAVRDIHLGPDPERKGKYLKRTILMHQVINNTPSGFHTDHINHNGLDNRRQNLRTATNSENHGNMPKQKGSWSSSYKGVTWWKRDQNWRAQIFINGRTYNFGYFSNEIEAAHIYNQIATQLFGEFAHLNDI